MQVETTRKGEAGARPEAGRAVQPRLRVSPPPLEHDPERRAPSSGSGFAPGRPRPGRQRDLASRSEAPGARHFEVLGFISGTVTDMLAGLAWLTGTGLFLSAA